MQEQHKEASPFFNASSHRISPSLWMPCASEMEQLSCTQVMQHLQLIPSDAELATLSNENALKLLKHRTWYNVEMYQRKKNSLPTKKLQDLGELVRRSIPNFSCGKMISANKKQKMAATASKGAFDHLASMPTMPSFKTRSQMNVTEENWPDWAKPIAIPKWFLAEMKLDWAVCKNEQVAEAINFMKISDLRTTARLNGISVFLKKKQIIRLLQIRLMPTPVKPVSFNAVDLDDLTYREMQLLAQEYKVKSNQSREVLATLLRRICSRQNNKKIHHQDYASKVQHQYQKTNSRFLTPKQETQAIPSPLEDEDFVPPESVRQAKSKLAEKS